MPESYAEIEALIEQALHKLHACENPNVAAVAREFQVPVTRLCARWNGRSSKQNLSRPNKRLTDDQELAVCLYLQRLDTIGISARFPMVTNSILRRSYDSAAAALDSIIPPPTVSSCWTSRFLKRHPEFYIRKQKSLERQRKEAHHPDDIRTWFERYKTVCDEKAIQEGDRYNFDETRFRIGVGHDQ
jgi:hypothetical protein